MQQPNGRVSGKEFFIVLHSDLESAVPIVLNMAFRALTGLLAKVPRLAVPRRFVASKVNQIYQPGLPGVKCHPTPHSCTRSPCMCMERSAKDSVLARHAADRVWSPEELSDAARQHALFTWGATAAMNDAAIQVERGEGIYFWDMKGKRYIDFNSMAMCLHLGHSPHPSIVKAVKEQMETLAYAYPGISSTPIRAKLCQLLSEIVPGDINSFIFPSSGSEANECAMRMSRLMTGRHKIFARYRSYHGGTLGTMGLTGDQRRWPTEPFSSTGIVHFFDPYPYSFSLYALLLLFYRSVF
jgi:taurine--2-oxoglutarate transaminase